MNEAIEAVVGIYRVLLVDWDLLRELGDNRDTLWSVQNGNLTELPHYLSPYKLQATSLGEVFEVLNIRQPENFRLKPGARSLSVGDVVIDPDERVWICRPVGWHEVTGDERKGLLDRANRSAYYERVRALLEVGCG